MNLLEKARPENSFRCADGSLLGSVYELENRLCTMSSEAFYHHVNPVRNDFHNWVRDVFQDYELANELLGARTPAQAAAIVRKHLRKALLAKEEIENAIKTASTAKSKPATRAAGVTQRKKQRKPKKRKKPKKAAATAKKAKKNRKLNKKHNKKRLNRVAAKKKKMRKRAKKQVNRWLNWLKIVPEL